MAHQAWEARWRIIAISTTLYGFQVDMVEVHRRPASRHRACVAVDHVRPVLAAPFVLTSRVGQAVGSAPHVHELAVPSARPAGIEHDHRVRPGPHGRCATRALIPRGEPAL